MVLSSAPGRYLPCRKLDALVLKAHDNHKIYHIQLHPLHNQKRLQNLGCSQGQQAHAKSLLPVRPGLDLALASNLATSSGKAGFGFPPSNSCRSESFHTLVGLLEEDDAGVKSESISPATPYEFEWKPSTIPDSQSHRKQQWPDCRVV